jgi:putative ABC transport system ATP-binding protein
MIELMDVRKVFNAGRPNEFVAVNGVSLSIEPCRITALKGPSGSGKTTLLSMIGCMARPTSGRITLMDRELTSLPEKFLTEIRRKTFGFIFQQFNLIKGLTALENVIIPAYPLGGSYALLKQRALELLAIFDLSDKASARVEWLSGGEAQRTAIARALINNPAVIIADEPTGNLDSKLSRDFMKILGKLREDHKTVLVSSHDPIVFNSDVVERVVCLRDGKVDGNGDVR